MKQPKGRLYRWSVRLSTYTFKIIHRSGRSQAHVDALSRAAISSKTPPIQYSEVPKLSHYVPDTRAPNTEQSTPDGNCNEPKCPSQHRSQYQLCTTLLHSVRTSPEDELLKAQAHSDLSFVKRPIHRQSLTYVRHGERLKVVVPESLRDVLLIKFHDLHGHTGKSKILQLLSDHYWWPTMVADAHKHIESCIPCQRSKPSHQPTLGKYTVPEQALRPKSLISADTIVISRTSEPLPELRANLNTFMFSSTIIPVTSGLLQQSLTPLKQSKHSSLNYFAPASSPKNSSRIMEQNLKTTDLHDFSVNTKSNSISLRPIIPLLMALPNESTVQ